MSRFRDRGAMPSPHQQGSSFRDPAGTVVVVEDHVYRIIHAEALDEWRSFSESALFRELQKARLIVPSYPATKVPPALNQHLQSETIIEHERIPVISYPYEWSYEMLRQAALLHLEIMERCLGHDFILKDASSFNIQFVGPDPIFIDVLSFVRWRRGEPWNAYNQFCKMFLYPLLLHAYKQVPFQSWIRSELEGLDPKQLSHLMSFRDTFRSGVLTHVHMQAWMQKRFSNSSRSTRAAVRSSGFSKTAIQNNVRGLHRLLSGLPAPKEKSHWSHYDTIHQYSDSALAQKEVFVESTLATRSDWRLIWDLGCNTGQFSQLAAKHADYVIAMDSDHCSVDSLYERVRKEKIQNVLPLVVNLANPSPDQGWAGQERRDLWSRGRPDVILCLALTHHVVLSSNIPLQAFVGWLGSATANLIIEFVDKKDPMAERLLLNKDDTYRDYNQNNFEACLKEHFLLEKQQTGATRTLYYASHRKA